MIEMNNIIENLRKTLLSEANEEYKARSQRFFKETVECYGIKTPIINKISKVCLKSLLKNLDKNQILNLCTQLWKSGILEESIVACNWAYSLRKQYVEADFLVFKNWISQYVNNWASCDTLCNHTVGEFIQMYPEYLLELQQFTKSNNIWVRRAAAVTLIIPAKKGLFLSNILSIADDLLIDPQDLVQKGYGWMLKAASQAHQDEIYRFVSDRKRIMPRTALRYAIEKMPSELRKEAMKR